MYADNGYLYTVSTDWSVSHSSILCKLCKYTQFGNHSCRCLIEKGDNRLDQSIPKFGTILSGTETHTDIYRHTKQFDLFLPDCWAWHVLAVMDPLIYIIYFLSVIYSPAPISLFTPLYHLCAFAAEAAQQSKKQAKNLEQSVAHLLKIFL